MARSRQQRQRLRTPPNDTDELARLRSEVARLRAEVRRLKRRPEDQVSKVDLSLLAAVPDLPRPDASGYYPAKETLRALLAQQIARRRAAAGWTQAQLAMRAGIRQETVCRIESGKNAPNVATVDKLDGALKEVGG